MKITNCKTNHMTNPMGYTLNGVNLSWNVEDCSGKNLASARVTVWTDGGICYDSGNCKDANFLCFNVPLKLEPRTRYYWKVAVVTDCGEEGESGVNYFETNKMDEKWQAQWLTCERGTRHPVFRKKLNITKPVKSARLYICGLGLYEAYLTGEKTSDGCLTKDNKISDEILTPYCTNYAKWVQYQTYDITDRLTEGSVLNVLLGVGWYLGRFGFFSKQDSNPYYGKEHKLIAEVDIEYADGTTEVIGTDESWQVWRSNITFSNIYDGEGRDDTLPAAPLEKCIIASAPDAEFCGRYSLHVKVHEQFKPIELIHTPKGETVLDIGQNIAGGFSLKVNAPRGTKVRLQFGEVMQNGCFYRDNLRTAKAEFNCVCGGGESEIYSRFTYYGYRYVKVEGVPNLKKEDFTAYAAYSDMQRIGYLNTQNDKVNRLISNVEWGLKGNFLDVPTDCPQRDERMGWTGDAQVFSATACYFMDTYQFYTKYLHDMYTEQTAFGGMVPNMIPSFGEKGTACVWGDAATIIPWNVYNFYGDKEILKNQYASMKAWVDYISKVDGDNQGWKRVFHYGDWLALDHPNPTVSQRLGGTDEGYIAYVYYGYSAGIVAQAAEILGYGKDAEYYYGLKNKIYDSIREEYFSPKGKCCINTQTGMVLALRYKLVKPDMVVKDLQLLFEKTDHKLRTGFVGTPLLCPTLTENGLEGLAYDLLFNEEYPGWLYEVNLGATTIWERWNSINPDGSISSTGMNSLNHYSYGSIAEWLFKYVAGLAPVKAGFKEVSVAPVIDARLGGIELEYNSAAGKYKVSWQVKGDRDVTINVEVPFGCTAYLKLYKAPDKVYSGGNAVFADVSDGVCKLGAGSYSVSYTAAEPLKK
ncbi:MAG: glycoside hydrolase family 78 protein [Clostridia bacterium]|nr:glycoside hydrolase family 78 protein [Clostridia bacterium]